MTRAIQANPGKKRGSGVHYWKKDKTLKKLWFNYQRAKKALREYLVRERISRWVLFKVFEGSKKEWLSGENPAAKKAPKVK